MLMDKKHPVGAGNVPYTLCETTQFICVAVNPCFCMGWVFDEVAVLQIFVVSESVTA